MSQLNANNNIYNPNYNNPNYNNPNRDVIDINDIGYGSDRNDVNKNIIKVDTNLLNSISDIKKGFNGSEDGIESSMHALGSQPQKLQAKVFNVLKATQPEVQPDEAPSEKRVREEDLVDINPQFTYENLNEITSGDFNVGELTVKADGSLGKINNHVRGFRWKNKVKLTPEQNLEVRKQTWKCLEMVCGNVARQNEFPGRGKLETVKALLLNERDRTMALSRDEVHFLIMMLRTDGQDGVYTEKNFEKLHEFKIGKEANASGVRDFVKGLANGNSKTQKRVARSVSANAQQGIVPFVLNEIRNFFLGLFGPGKKSVGCADVKSMLHRKCGTRAGNADGQPKPYDVFGKKSLDGVFESVARSYVLPANRQLERNVPIRIADNTDHNLFHNDCMREIGNLIRSKIDAQIHGLNPRRVLEPGSNLLMRQSSIPSASAVSSVINSVLQSGNEDALEHLRTNVFTDESCTLLDEKGRPKTYYYKDYMNEVDGCSPFEEIVNRHVKACNGRLSKNQKWDPLEAAYRILGFIPDGSGVLAFREDEAAGFVRGLNHLLTKKARFAVCSSRGSITNPTANKEFHHYSLSLPERLQRPDNDATLLEDGTGTPVGFKVHVVSDRPDGPNGEYEFDHVFEFKDMYSKITSGKLKFGLFSRNLKVNYDQKNTNVIEEEPKEEEISTSNHANNGKKTGPRRIVGSKSVQKEENPQPVSSTLDQMRDGIKIKTKNLGYDMLSFGFSVGDMKKKLRAWPREEEKIVEDSVKKDVKTLYRGGKEREPEAVLFAAWAVESYLEYLSDVDILWLIEEYAKEKMPGVKCKFAKKNGSSDGYTTNIDITHDVGGFVEWAAQKFAKVSSEGVDYENSKVFATLHTSAKKTVNEWKQSGSNSGSNS